MKKVFSYILTSLLVCVMLLSLVPQQAEAAGASLSGSTSLRAGNTVTLTFSVSGSNLFAVDTGLTYDSSKLELLEWSSLRSGWQLDKKSGGGFLLEDTRQSNPINGSAKLFSLKFRVKSGVADGSTVSVSVTNVKATSTEASSSLGSASWSAKILPPLSGDATLKSMSCSNAELNFTGGTEYSLTVPYEVSSLKLSTTANHSGAKVSVSGNSLSVGSNTVTVTVTAENGNTKRYYIYVTRQQDPNYVPSTDAALSSMTPSAGTLSPVFHTDVTEYVLYVPYETTALTISGSARDSKALGVSTKREVLVVPEETAPEETAASFLHERRHGCSLLSYLALIRQAC